MQNIKISLCCAFSTLLILAACGKAPKIPPPKMDAPAEQAASTPTQVIQTQTPAPTQVSLPNETTTPTSTPAARSLPENFTLVRVPGSYQFTEGPAVDANGNIYFSDINAGKIYKWSTDGSISVFLEKLNKPNGLMFDQSGNLIACEGGAGRLISIDPQGKITVLADKYKGTPFNEPNDLWIDPQGGIYFTDPAYQSPVVQDGQHVYYLSPDHSAVTRVISDMTQPNGLIGTPDGKTLFVADYGANKTYAYAIQSDGSLSDKRLFVASGSDGMELDQSGNLYLSNGNQVKIFNSSGSLLRSIPIPQETPTNIAFGGADGQTLFITARTRVYTANLKEQK